MSSRFLLLSRKWSRARDDLVRLLVENTIGATRIRSLAPRHLENCEFGIKCCTDRCNEPGRVIRSRAPGDARMDTPTTGNAVEGIKTKRRSRTRLRDLRLSAYPLHRVAGCQRIHPGIAARTCCHLPWPRCVPVRAATMTSRPQRAHGR